MPVSNIETERRFYRDHLPTFSDQRDWTVPAVLAARAASHKDKIFVSVPSTGEILTYRQAHESAQRVAAGLIKEGIEPGDRLMILMQNNLSYLIAWLGAAVAGVVEVPVNTANRGSFLEHQIQVTRPSCAVVTPEFAPHLACLAEARRSIRTVYLVADAAQFAPAAEILRGAGFSCVLFTDLLGSDLMDGPGVNYPEVDYRDPAAIFFTSGTTGPSKGVTMSHSHMTFFADQCRSLTRLTEADTYLSVGPLFHGNSHFLAAYPALLVGARYVMRESFSASKWATWVRESGATVTNLIGVMMEFIHSQPPAVADSDNLLRCVFTAPTAWSIVNDFRHRFGIEAIVEVFGLTETSQVIVTPYGAERPKGAVGLLADDWFDARVVDPETDEEVPDGDTGELVVRPRVPFTMTTGYYGAPEATVQATRNYWFHTGDRIRRDEAGWYYFVDRLKDSLRRRGENISSFELEQAISACDEIAEVAVVAVAADHDAGEDEVMACVVLRKGSDATAGDVWRFCDENLPAFASPRYLRFMDVLPKTPTEKVQKKNLRELGTRGALDRLSTATREVTTR
ncbi:MAG: AMP-binding protein [Acidimicrobiales bacterium]